MFYHEEHTIAMAKDFEFAILIVSLVRDVSICIKDKIICALSVIKQTVTKAIFEFTCF